MHLPPEIHQEIGLHLPLSSQGRFHQVNRNFSQFKFPFEQCCTAPTRLEIAKWLYNQSQLLKYDVSAESSIFQRVPYTTFDEIEDFVIDFTFKTNTNTRRVIKLSLDTGRLTGRNTKHELMTVQDILSYIGDSKLTLFAAGTRNWYMIRDIFSLRASCILQNVSSDTCLIQFMIDSLDQMYAEHLKDPRFNKLTWFVLNILDVLNRETGDQFIADFGRDFLGKTISNGIFRQADFVQINTLDPSKVLEWIKLRLMRLTPDDLANDSSEIRWENTNYR